MSAAKKSAPKGNGLLPKELAESWSKLGMTMGAVSCAAGKTLRLTKMTARETVPNYEATGWHIRTLRCQAHALRPGMNIAHPLAIAAAGPRLPRSS